ncbi:hypothetical protein YSA_03695 [Pseudomonas putida ND6]|uniref:Uncharacterized protein n=1 Tax=Pseudomonas putida ND6 TaxID=231023 RepID=I3UTE3_PSEPU|nr:hypothetical protein YSA_03695 [Pseudomonas putida ND6]
MADADPILHQTMADAAGRAVFAAACGMVAAYAAATVGGALL